MIATNIDGFFFEALLSAREKLIITYVGQNIRDNTELPACELLEELLDTLVESYAVSQVSKDLANEAELSESIVEMRKRLIVRHPLQSFSPRYFGADEDQRLFSYAGVYLNGALSLVGENKNAPSFFDGFSPIVEIASAAYRRRSPFAASSSIYDSAANKEDKETIDLEELESSLLTLSAGLCAIASVCI